MRYAFLCTSALALAFVAGIGLAAAQQQPPTAEPQQKVQQPEPPHPEDHQPELRPQPAPQP